MLDTFDTIFYFDTESFSLSCLGKCISMGDGNFWPWFKSYVDAMLLGGQFYLDKIDKIIDCNKLVHCHKSLGITDPDFMDKNSFWNKEEFNKKDYYKIFKPYIINVGELVSLKKDRNAWEKILLLNKLNYDLIKWNGEDLKMVELEMRKGFWGIRYVLKCGETEFWVSKKNDELGKKLLEMFKNLGCDLKT